jgi:hypothetical protein
LTPPPAIQVVKACGLWSRPGAALLHDRQPAELAAADHQRRVEQPALLEIGEQAAIG